MKETLWHRLFRGVRRLRQQPYWERFAGPGWDDRVMGEVLTDRFYAKQGRTIVRWPLRAGGRELVVYLKRHYCLPWWHGLLALLWPEGRWSPALREWEHLEWARAEGLPVPLAAACGEFIGPWCRLQSFLAVEELTDMLPLHEAIPAAAAHLGPDAFERWKKGLIREMAALAMALHRRRRFHKDLYLCHFYVAAADTARAPTDWRGRVQMIDLHRLGHHPRAWPWWLAKDLAQLLYSSDVPGITPRDRLRFWRSYLAGNPDRWLARWLRVLIRVKAWNHRRRARRKARVAEAPPRHDAAA
jgi:heptose I phosphotransferase